ncbi:MAG: hypothetical protein ACLSV2_01310 [Clostridium sp.]
MKSKLTKSIAFVCILTLTAVVGIGLYSCDDPAFRGQNTEMNINL